MCIYISPLTLAFAVQLLYLSICRRKEFFKCHDGTALNVEKACAKLMGFNAIIGLFHPSV